MALLTVSQVREHVESCLDGDALQRIIDNADAEIIRRLGPLSTQTEVLPGVGIFLHLQRRATAITSADERVQPEIGDATDFDLSANDYSLLSDGYRVERLVTGDNAASAWRGKVTIVYTPVDEQAQREMLLVNLVKLEERYSGVSSEGVGDVRETQNDYTKERNALFSGLRTQGRRLIV